jgi:hypothetical protein
MEDVMSTRKRNKQRRAKVIVPTVKQPHVVASSRPTQSPVTITAAPKEVVTVSKPVKKLKDNDFMAWCILATVAVGSISYLALHYFSIL